LFKFLTHIKNVIAFQQLPKAQRRIVFYSEGKNYWVHLEGLIKELLDKSDIPVCYISSSSTDPGLTMDHENYHTFEIDEGFVRNWLFENIDTELMVMTMPDLHQYQVKRSKHKVHYVYLQHSLVSLHMVYRHGAFDHYDTIFCATQFHMDEIRALEEKYNLPEKNIVKHGYARLDSIIEEAKKRPMKPSDSDQVVHVLIAPSWGPDGVIESGLGMELVNRLMESGYRVTFRPHPQTIKFADKNVNQIVAKYQSDAMFDYENNVAGQDSLHHSDIMISDWSGAALDYAFGLNKPVVFINIPRKVNNAHYEDIDLIPFETLIRTQIGTIIEPDVLTELESVIDQTLTKPRNFQSHPDLFNVTQANAVGAQKLIEMLQN